MFDKLFRRPPSANGIEKLEPILDKSYRFVAIDVETANAHAGSICQIGLACVGASGVEAVVTLLIDPKCEFDPMNIRIHGIKPAQVDGKLTFSAFLEAAEDFLDRNPLVQHSSFDGRAIRCATENWGRVPRPLQWHDSVMVARRAWPEFRGNGGHGLSHLKTALGLDFRHHDAGEDARAAAEVVLRAEAHLQKPLHEILAMCPSGGMKKPVAMEGKPDALLSGKIAVFTGALSMTRVEAAGIAACAGITTSQSVSKKVDLLVIGDQDVSVLAPGKEKSSKHRKAEDLIAKGHDMRIMGETEFLALVGQR